MDIQEGIDNFSNTRIAVVGDVMLDQSVYGEVQRVSPEAPVPIVKVERDDFSLGGAANVATNILSLGGNVSLFGAVGKDKEGEKLVSLLKERRIEYNLMNFLEQTTTKIRVLGKSGGGAQQITRIDRESVDSIVASSEKYKDMIENLFSKNPEVIVVSDYAKGFISRELIEKLKSRAGNIPIIVDPRPENKDNYLGVYLITPNLREAVEMSGRYEIEDIGRELQKKLNCNILLTRGRDGMTLFENDKRINIPTSAKEVYDVTGAGDTVVAAMALGLASGLDLEQAAVLANHAAGIAIGKAGTASVSRSELGGLIEEEYGKIKNLEELKMLIEDYRRKGKRVVWTNGCFDILHSGHIKYLQEAKQQGQVLIVGINSDDSIRKLKGLGRPAKNELQRAEILSSLEPVDYVIIFSEENVVRYLQELRPEVYVNGGDRTVDTINQQERKVVEGYGGRIYITQKYGEDSTTKILKRLQKD